MQKKTILIIGSGACGTALSVVASSCGHDVFIKTRDSNKCNVINKNHHNSQIFPNLTLSSDIKAVLDYDGEVDSIIFAMPSEVLANALKNNINNYPKADIIIATKGMRHEIPELFSNYCERELKINPIFLSGPSFASELVRKLPTTCNIACKNLDKAKEVAEYLSNEYFALTPTDDIISVQISGCYKNILAIYCGYIAEKGYGDNYRAKICTEGLDELKLICLKLGGKAETIYSYSGVGDILLSCFSPQSRNYQFGRYLANNLKLKDNSTCVEGMLATKSLANICAPFYKELNLLPTIKHLIENFEEPQWQV